MRKNLTTDKEEQRARRNAAIRSKFEMLAKQNPLASNWRVCTHLAKEYGLTSQQIKNIVTQ